MLSRSFIYDNGASLRGKGYDFAVSRVTHFLAEHYRKHGREGYVLVFDFSKYFDTAQHEPVFREFERSGIDDRLVALSKYFIQNFGDVGLGLGSQVSQIAALALPNRIDHYIKDVLGMKYYARYMDDGCIISESKEKARDLPPGAPAAMRRARYPPQSEKRRRLSSSRAALHSSRCAFGMVQTGKSSAGQRTRVSGT